MIAKHVAMRTARKSDFGELVRYITDTQGLLERVGLVTVTNCLSDNPTDAVLEVRLTQQENTRSSADKTYHLIVSFRAGEEPTPDVLRAVEQRLCVGLGFGEHQRISAAHHDTDNVHLHIAINKVHPTRLTVHSPYNDHKTLGKLCEALEQEFCLEVDNHLARKRGAENRAVDMERHTGVESLIGWIQRECLDRLQAAAQWAEVHDILHEHGLQILPRGSGFILTDGDGTQAKASSVARALSKGALEKRLGPFEPSRHVPPAGKGRAATRDEGEGQERGGVNPQTVNQQTVNQGGRSPRYCKQPVRSRIDTAALFGRYQREQQDLAPARAAGIAVLRLRQQAQIQSLFEAHALKRQALQVVGGERVAKQLLRVLVKRSLKSELTKLRAQHRRERLWLQQKYVRRAWADWLQAKALQGDQAALSVLRAREDQQGLRGNTVGGPNMRHGPGGSDKDDTHRTEFVPTPEAPRTHPTSSGIKTPATAQDRIAEMVTKQGTVIYRVGNAAIRDDGDRLQVSRGATSGGVHAALQLAIARYGHQLTVAGSDEFKSRVVATAAAAFLPLTFADADLERRRVHLVSQHPRNNQHGTTHDPEKRRRTHAGSPGAARADATLGRFTFSGTTRAGASRDSARAGPDVASASGTTGPRGGSPFRVDDVQQAGALGSSAFPGRVGHRTPHGKPDLGRIGAQPPPFSQNRLRDLSQLGVVQFAEGGAVLLPGDVHRDVVQPQTQPADALRREQSRPANVSAPALGHALEADAAGAAGAADAADAAEAAAAKFIAERDAKRAAGLTANVPSLQAANGTSGNNLSFDIPKYQRYTGAGNAVATYAGTRCIDGQFLALLARSDHVAVLPVDADAARRLKRIRIGQPVVVTATEGIRSKGRSR